MDQSLFLPELSECRYEECSTRSNMKPSCSSRAVLPKPFTSPGVPQWMSSTNNSEWIRGYKDHVQVTNWSRIKDVFMCQYNDCKWLLEDQKNLIKERICTDCWKCSCEQCLRPWGCRATADREADWVLLVLYCSLPQTPELDWPLVLVISSVLLCFTPQQAKK